MLHVIPEALTYTWCTNVSDILPITCQADSVDLNLHSPEGEVRPTSIDGKRTHGISLFGNGEEWEWRTGESVARRPNPFAPPPGIPIHCARVAHESHAPVISGGRRGGGRGRGGSIRGSHVCGVWVWWLHILPHAPRPPSVRSPHCTRKSPRSPAYTSSSSSSHWVGSRTRGIALTSTLDRTST
jgi:hypothetical protein